MKPTPPVLAVPRVPPGARAAILRLLLVLAAILPGQAAEHDGPDRLPRPGMRLALIGDSITEQKCYTRFVEDYLLMCRPELQADVCNMGWGGECAKDFLLRMEADFAAFRPDLATVFYGMNDASRAVYVAPMETLAGRLRSAGIAALIVSPGAMDTYYGNRGGDRNFPVGFNQEQGLMGVEARRIAAGHGLGFVDLHTPLLEVMAKAKARFHPNYDVCGSDGVHPRANGHLVMAWAILKGLGMSGDLGTITVDMRGPATADGGHRIIAGASGRIEVESPRYPFCFVDAGRRLSPDQPDFAGSTAGILPCLPFNDELNRLRLVVSGLEWGRAKVTWGTASRVFTRQELERGINLAAEFIANPFTDAFARVDAAVMEQQRSETVLIKHVIAGRPFPKPSPAADGTVPPEKPMPTRDEAIARRAELQAAARAAVTPVRHRIVISKAD